MNTFSKVVSMFLVVVMCFGLFATSAYAEFDFGQGNSTAAGDGFNFGGSSAAPVNESSAASDGFTLNDSKVQTSDTFTVNVEDLTEAVTANNAAAEEKQEEEQETETTETAENANVFEFGTSSETATFDKPYTVRNADDSYTVAITGTGTYNLEAEGVALVENFDWSALEAGVEQKITVDDISTGITEAEGTVKLQYTVKLQ